MIAALTTCDFVVRINVLGNSTAALSAPTASLGVDIQLAPLPVFGQAGHAMKRIKWFDLSNINVESVLKSEAMNGLLRIEEFFFGEW